MAEYRETAIKVRFLVADGLVKAPIGEVWEVVSVQLANEAGTWDVRIRVTSAAKTEAIKKKGNDNGNEESSG